MAEKAATPGATFLGSLGYGLNKGMDHVIAARKAATEQDAARAAAALAKYEAKPDLMKLQNRLSTLQRQPRSAQNAQLIQQTLQAIEKLTTHPGGLAAAARAFANATQGKNAYTDKLGETIGGFTGDVIKKGPAANDALIIMDDLRGLIASMDEQGIQTAWTATFMETVKDNARAIAENLGLEVPATLLRDYPDVAAFEAAANALVAPLLKPLMGARPSDKDLEFLIRMLPNFRFSKEKNLKIMRSLEMHFGNDLLKSVRTMEKGIEGSRGAIPEWLLQETTLQRNFWMRNYHIKFLDADKMYKDSSGNLVPGGGWIIPDGPGSDEWEVLDKIMKITGEIPQPVERVSGG
jgi:hypothetical protein